jgi:predicted small lipoprotein YifL
MRKTIALLIAALLAVAPLAGCGEEQPTAAEFCQPHGGVNVELNEADGDATCNDGTEFEGDGDSEDESSDKKKKKKRR